MTWLLQFCASVTKLSMIKCHKLQSRLYTYTCSKQARTVLNLMLHKSKSAYRQSLECRTLLTMFLPLTSNLCLHLALFCAGSSNDGSWHWLKKNFFESDLLRSELGKYIFNLSWILYLLWLTQNSSTFWLFSKCSKFSDMVFGGPPFLNDHALNIVHYRNTQLPSTEISKISSQVFFLVMGTLYKAK